MSRLHKYLNEGKPWSIHRVKKEYIIVANEFIYRIAKEYGIKDYDIYNIKITSKINYSGLCDKSEKIIYIQTSEMGNIDTLYHEMAHWLQQVKWGIESFCQDMGKYKRFNKETANHHNQLIREIRELSKRWGYEEKFRTLIQ